jgi:hypothetical protein
LNIDTSCGIAVICTVCAAYRPTAEPISAPAISTIQPVAVTVPSWISRISVATPRSPCRHRHLVAPARGGRAVHQVQADHEAGRRQHVDELDVPVNPLMSGP